MASVLKPEQDSLEATIDAGMLVSRFPGPACLVNADRAVVLANALWDAVVTAAAGDPSIPVELIGSLLAAQRTGRPQRALATVEADAGKLNLDVTYLPCVADGAASVMVLATDLGMIEMLQGALVDSREFHRDLALCSSDAMFEVDAAGRFTYVGPCGFLGYADFELDGTTFAELASSRSAKAADQLVKSREPIWEAEIWFKAVAGEELCFLVSAMPVTDSEGAWSGLRGVGRDVTEQRAREAEIERAKRSQRNVDAVLHAIRSEADPEVMVRAGATAVLDALGVDACLVIAAPVDRTAHIVACSGTDAEHCDARFMAVEQDEWLGLFNRVLTPGPSGPCEGRISGCAVLLAATRYAGKVNGGLVFLRQAAPGDDPWLADDRHLLRVIADQIGVALAQLELSRQWDRNMSPQGAR